MAPLHRINATRMEFIKRYISLAGANVIDVGCGGGILSESLAKEQALVTGIDIAYDLIEVAKTHAQNANLSINYECVDIVDFNHVMNFDAVMCLEMLEHADPELILNHIVKFLKPGGKLFISTINRTICSYLGVIVGAEYLFKILPRGTHQYKNFIKPSEIQNILSHHQCYVNAISGIEYNPLTHNSKLGSSVSMNYIMCFTYAI